jgi:hypothetical protein
MIWHRRLDHHAAHRWLRATLLASVKETRVLPNDRIAIARPPG